MHTSTRVPALVRTQRHAPLGLGASPGWGSGSVGHSPRGRKREGTGIERDGSLGLLFTRTTTTKNLALGIEKSRAVADFRCRGTQGLEKSLQDVVSPSFRGGTVRCNEDAI